MNRDFTKPAEIQAHLEDLQKKYETTSLSKDSEKKIINEMKQLKMSLPNAIKLHELKPEADKLYEKRNVLKEELSIYKAEIIALSTDLEGVRKQ